MVLNWSRFQGLDHEKHRENQSGERVGPPPRLRHRVPPPPATIASDGVKERPRTFLEHVIPRSLPQPHPLVASARALAPRNPRSGDDTPPTQRPLEPARN